MRIFGNAGHVVKKGDPASAVAAFNYQQAATKDLARFGYATLRAFTRLQQR